MKHGEDVQPVPDRVRGDGGMEAYRLDDQIVYQCYAPEDAFTVAAQTSAQQVKINRDIKKLTANCAQTQKILGGTYEVRRWVLLTPNYDDKSLVMFARKKSETVRKDAKAKWCAADFEIVIHTDRELFPAQLAVLHGVRQTSISLEVPVLDEAEVYAALEEGLADKLREKLRVDPSLASNAEDLEGYCFETLMDYVYGTRQMEVLQSRYSVAYELVEARSKTTHRSLRRRLQGDDGGPGGMERLAAELSAAIAADVPALLPTACEELARYYIATWWVQCPLKFREPA